MPNQADLHWRPGAPSIPSTQSTLEQELAFLVRWLDAAKRDQQYPLERAHYLMLLLLRRDGPQSVGRLAERLRLDASTVTRQVSVMTSRGLVCKQPNPGDRRGGMVCATALGHQETNRMQTMREEKVGAIVQGWPEEKRQALVRALGDLNQSLCRILDEDEFQA